MNLRKNIFTALARARAIKKHRSMSKHWRFRENVFKFQLQLSASCDEFAQRLRVTARPARTLFSTVHVESFSSHVDKTVPRATEKSYQILAINSGSRKSSSTVMSRGSLSLQLNHVKTFCNGFFTLGHVYEPVNHLRLTSKQTSDSFSPAPEHEKMSVRRSRPETGQNVWLCTRYVTH